MTLPLDPALVQATVQMTIICDKQADGPAIFNACPVVLLGIRQGTYGKYDDILAVVHRDGWMHTYRGNTQPGRAGWRAAISKYYPQLRCGVWPEIRGRHSIRPNRFRQPNRDQAKALGLERYFKDGRARGMFQVDRMSGPETIAKTEWGTFSINVHDSPEDRTGSAGCITAPVSVYLSMRDLIYAEMDEAGQAWLPLVIVAGPI